MGSVVVVDIFPVGIVLVYIYPMLVAGMTEKLVDNTTEVGFMLDASARTHGNCEVTVSPVELVYTHALDNAVFS